MLNSAKILWMETVYTQRTEISGRCLLQRACYFEALAIIPVGISKTVLLKLIAGIWENANNSKCINMTECRARPLFPTERERQGSVARFCGSAHFKYLCICQPTSPRNVSPVVGAIVEKN